KSLETEEAVSPSDGDEEGKAKGLSILCNKRHSSMLEICFTENFQQVLQVSPLSSFHEVTIYGDPHPAIAQLFGGSSKSRQGTFSLSKSSTPLNPCEKKSQHNKILLTKKMEMSRIALLIMTFPVMFPLFAHLKFMEMNHLDAGPIVPTATAIIAPEAVHVAERPITNWGLERRHRVTHHRADQDRTAKLGELILAARHRSV
ncbi:hypothetical protein Prudu_013931, partial [Prunus dulcis]